MKKAIGILLALLMTAGLAGCAAPQGTSTAAPTAAAAGGTATQAPGPGGEAAASANEPYTMSMFGNLASEIKIGDESFFKALTEQTNTTIDLQIPPSGNYDEALTIMLAGGDYSEAVLFPNHTMVPYMDAVRNGVILPLNDYIANAPNLLQYSYEVSWKTLKVLGDDNIYGIPRTSIARADGFMVRQDWLDNVGITIEEGKPITLDRLTEILSAFTNKDPDGNGVDDTYGLALSTGDGNLNIPDPIAWAHGLVGWQEFEGEDYQYMDLRYSKKNDAFKRALEYTNMLWSNKLIDPDWPTLNTEAYQQRFSQGITGVRAEFSGWLPDRESELQKVNPDAKLSYLVGFVQNEGDKVQGGSFSTGFWGEWAVMSSAKDPQRVVDTFDFLLSDAFWDTTKYGLVGISWEYDANQNKIAIPDQGVTAARNILRRNDDPQFFVGLNTPVEHRARIENLIGICIEQSIFSKDEGFRPAIADDPTFIDADKAYKVSVSKIIVGDLPVSEYDNVLDTWYKAGGQTYIEQMNAGIQAGQ